MTGQDLWIDDGADNLSIAPASNKHGAKSGWPGKFYMVPAPWADRAVEVVGGKSQLILAFRLYRRWRMRRPDETAVDISNTTFAGPGFSHDSKRRMQRKLAAAGLIEIVEQRAGRAPRIRVVERV